MGEETLRQRKVQKFIEMGFDAGKVRAALERSNWNEEAAMEIIISSM